mmetsp:Transcript_113446/g.354785  ORF Transcript_113446/g.354785 Transcript_113446/m.354785 type:complete len:275 (-) Transcript_113446:1297-2121(-)
MRAAPRHGPHRRPAGPSARGPAPGRGRPRRPGHRQRGPSGGHQGGLARRGQGGALRGEEDAHPVRHHARPDDGCARLQRRERFRRRQCRRGAAAHGSACGGGGARGGGGGRGAAAWLLEAVPAVAAAPRAARGHQGAPKAQAEPDQEPSGHRLPRPLPRVGRERARRGAAPLGDEDAGHDRVPQRDCRREESEEPAGLLQAAPRLLRQRQLHARLCEPLLPLRRPCRGALPAVARRAAGRGADAAQSQHAPRGLPGDQAEDGALRLQLRAHEEP